MDRLEAMTILVAAVEAGSLSGAGRRLGIPLPTVSRKIADLEAHLKARLLVRSTRRLSLTEVGEAYVAASRAILERVEELEARASGEYTLPRGTLSITAPFVFGRLHIVPLVSSFLAGFAQIDVEIRLSDQMVNIVEEHIDLAIRVGSLPDSALVATKVGQIRRVVCGSPRYFAARGIPKSPADLAEHTCVTFTSLAAGTGWVFKPIRQGAGGPRPLCRLKVNSAEAAIDAAIAGVGLTNVLSYQVVDAVAAGRLVIVLQDYEPEPAPIHLVHAGQSLPALKLRRFVEFATPRLRKTLADDLARLNRGVGSISGPGANMLPST
jgi:DNA-binding transcriptional LysR family regulator